MTIGMTLMNLMSFWSFIQ